MPSDKAIRGVNGVPTLVNPTEEVLCSNTELVKIQRELKIYNEMEK